MARQQDPSRNDTNSSHPATPMNIDTFQAYTLRTISTALSTKVDEITKDPSRSFRLGEAERELLSDIKGSGVYEGFGVAAATFILLRSGRSFALRRLRPPTTPQGSQQLSPFRAVNSAPTTNVARSPRSPLGVFHLIADFTASSMAGMLATVYLADQQKIATTLAKVPLVPGSSRLSQEFCPIIQAELNQLRRNAATEEQTRVLSNVGDGSSTTARMYLDALLQFEHNCNLRQAQEEMIRRQQGVGPEFPVSIPFPGVHEGDLDDMADEFTAGAEFLETDWIESFTIDEDNEPDSEK